jgi:hypothetical protein
MKVTHNNVEVKITGPNSDGEYWLILSDGAASGGMLLDLPRMKGFTRLIKQVATKPDGINID